MSFVIAEAVPVFNYLLALLGSVCFAPLAMILPAWFWIYDHSHRGSTGRHILIIYWLHWAMVLLGVYFFTAGTYATVAVIVDMHKTSKIGKKLLDWDLQSC